MPKHSRFQGLLRNQVLYSGTVVIFFVTIGSLRWWAGDMLFASLLYGYASCVVALALLAYFRQWLNKIGIFLSLLIFLAVLTAVYLRGEEQLVWVFPVLFVPALITPGRAAYRLVVLFSLAVMPAVPLYYDVIDGLRFLASMSLTVFCVTLFMRSRERETDHLTLLAGLDPLTNLGNRRSMEAAFKRLSSKNRGRYSLAVIDIDYFKQVNDSHGHLAGDHLLQEFSTLLKAHVPKRAQCFRFGGEEFIVIYPESLQNAMANVQLFLESVLEHQFASGLSVSFSAGVAAYRNDTLDGWVSRADHALLSAKQHGRCRVYMEK